jgi:uncharacterized protein YndB with AHSA1/START domain
MKLKFEQIIEAGRDRVWAAFDNPDNLKKWQPTLESLSHKSGVAGQTDAESELVYNEKGRRVVMTETVTERRKPDLMAGVYESRWGKTLIVNHFEVIDENTTRWISWCNFRFTGLMRFLALFTAGSIRRRTEADMDRFKLLVETELANDKGKP